MLLHRRLDRLVHRFSVNRPLALALLILTVAWLPAAAAELVPNGTFNSGIQSWATTIGPPNGSLQCVHSAKNSGDAAAASGSLGCTFTAPAIINVDSDCFAFAPNETFIWRADVLRAGTANLFASVDLLAYYGPNCTGGGASRPIARLPAGANWSRESVVFLNGPSFNNPQPPQSARAQLIFAVGSGLEDGNPQAVWFDNISLQPATFDTIGFSTCQMDQDRLMLCLNGHRFRVEGTFLTAQGQSGTLHGIPLTDDAGAFYFTNPKNLELNVKVLNACSFSGHYWVFVAGSTNVGINLLVTDLATGAVNTYTNNPQTTFVTVTDTVAFPCP